MDQERKRLDNNKIKIRMNTNYVPIYYIAIKTNNQLRLYYTYRIALQFLKFTRKIRTLSVLVQEQV